MTELAARLRLVIPVHGALRLSLRCLRSVLRFTRHPFELELVDDASEPFVAAALEGFLVDVPAGSGALVGVARRWRHETQQGFVKVCNQALARSRNELVLILNSDVTVTPGWLAPLVALMDARPQAALVTPLSNEASIHSVPLPEGWSVFEVAASLAQHGEASAAPDLVTASGFAMLLRREAVAALGAFDEAFSPGYGEESDLSMRLRAAGHEVLGCPKSYVHHRGRGSFGPRSEPFMEHPNYRLFMARWGPGYEAGLREMRRDGVLARLRSCYPDPPRRAPFAALRLLARMAAQRGLAYTISEAWRRGPRRLRAALGERGLKATASEVWRRRPRRAQRSAQGHLRARPALGGPVVTVLLEELGAAGGVKLLVELVNALALRGWCPRLVARADTPRDPGASASCLAAPRFVAGRRQLAEACAGSAVVIASLWSTVSDAAWLVAEGHAGAALHFVQDREELFYDDPRVRSRVIEAYGRLDLSLATTPWLAAHLRELGHSARVLGPGISHEEFYPPTERAPGPCRIAAMARPRQSRRGFEELVEAARGLYAERQDFELLLFGDTRAVAALPFAEVHGHLGVDALRRLYQRADVYVDASSHQAFGLPSFEAMACGAAVVGPREGGFSGLVREGAEALLVPGGDPSALSAAMSALIDAPERREALSKAGRARVAGLGVEAFIAGFVTELEALIEGSPRG